MTIILIRLLFKFLQHGLTIHQEVATVAIMAIVAILIERKVSMLNQWTGKKQQKHGHDQKAEMALQGVKEGIHHVLGNKLHGRRREVHERICHPLL